MRKGDSRIYMKYFFHHSRSCLLGLSFHLARSAFWRSSVQSFTAGSSGSIEWYKETISDCGHVTGEGDKEVFKGIGEGIGEPRDDFVVTLCEACDRHFQTEKDGSPGGILDIVH